MSAADKRACELQELAAMTSEAARKCADQPDAFNFRLAKYHQAWANYMYEQARVHAGVYGEVVSIIHDEVVIQRDDPVEWALQ